MYDFATTLLTQQSVANLMINKDQQVGDDLANKNRKTIILEALFNDLRIKNENRSDSTEIIAGIYGEIVDKLSKDEAHPEFLKISKVRPFLLIYLENPTDCDSPEKAGIRP